MVTRAAQRSYVEYFTDDATTETVASMSAVQFQEDFIGAGHTAGIPSAGAPAAGYPWVKKIVGAAPPTVAPVSNAQHGQVAAALTSTSEAEEATLYWNDSLSIDTTKALNIEFRAAASVLPSLGGVLAAVGVASAWVSGLTGAARYAFFGLSGSGALLVQSKDGATNNSFAATIGGAAVVVDTNMHLFRISFENVNDVAFYYDDTRVNAVGSVTWAASGANAILQPYAGVYKPSGVGVATMTIDKVDTFTNR